MDNDFVGIGDAAAALGLSRTSLQKLVDGGHLAAVKTAGGHRRIARASLEALQARMGITALRGARSVPDGGTGGAVHARPLTLLLAEDDEVIIAQLTGMLAENYPSVRVDVARDGLEAVLQLERNRPSIVVTDLHMQPFDGFRLIQLIRAKPEYRGVAILAVSSLSPREIEKRGGLPADVLFYRKPLSSERLRGYLDAFVQQQQLALE
ncbi:response regulator [Variovorax sp. VNK109]|jgi:excisionase family DNA binding protein|uniref:response regulator n=1 Tax=Variovorax sp. VNK109 TaxID=3400919 RepID=UPI003C017B6C